MPISFSIFFIKSLLSSVYFNILLVTPSSRSLVYIKIRYALVQILVVLPSTLVSNLNPFHPLLPFASYHSGSKPLIYQVILMTIPWDFNKSISLLCGTLSNDFWKSKYIVSTGDAPSTHLGTVFGPGWLQCYQRWRTCGWIICFTNADKPVKEHFMGNGQIRRHVGVFSWNHAVAAEITALQSLFFACYSLAHSSKWACTFDNNGCAHSFFMEGKML